MTNYKDQFEPAKPQFNLLKTCDEWMQCEIDNGIEISAQQAEDAEWSANCFVHGLFNMKGW